MDSVEKHALFTKHLLDWHQQTPRVMPWSNTKDPYLIWLSEIILQQTRVSQGWAYYEKFVRHYPTVHDLAAASEARVLKDWQGLGYNSRARNMHAAAKYIAGELAGKFPATYSEILGLKGVGPYTAAAIGSFAFDLPYPVVDGNVKRVLSRYFGISEPVDLPSTHRDIENKARSLMGSHQPSEFNQAIMNFGALQCTPINPGCQTCPMKASCAGFQLDLVDKLPVKSPRKKRKKRFFHYYFLSSGDQVILRKRTARDIWQHMYDFPVIENRSRSRQSVANRKAFLEEHGFAQANRTSSPVQYTQLLTHQSIHAIFYAYEISEIPRLPHDTWHLADRKNLSTFAFPKIIARYLEEQWGLK